MGKFYKIHEMLTIAGGDGFPEWNLRTQVCSLFQEICMLKQPCQNVKAQSIHDLVK